MATNHTFAHLRTVIFKWAQENNKNSTITNWSRHRSLSVTLEWFFILLIPLETKSMLLDELAQVTIGWCKATVHIWSSSHEANLYDHTVSDYWSIQVSAVHSDGQLLSVASDSGKLPPEKLDLEMQKILGSTFDIESICSLTALWLFPVLLAFQVTLWRPWI